MSVPYKSLVTSFINQWNFARNETYEILESLTDEQLQYIPRGEKWQPLLYQFGCLGRTQVVYTEAVKAGTMNFSLFSSDMLPKKNEFQKREDLKKFLQKANHEWITQLNEKATVEEFTIKWPDHTQPLLTHIASLGHHERFHHGQLISYFTLAGFDLPRGFKTNWAL